MPEKRNRKSPKNSDAHSSIASMNFWDRLKNPLPTLGFAFPEIPDDDADFDELRPLDALYQLPKAPKDDSSVYSLKISLEGARPEIWRRVLVKSITLESLHMVIQFVMGWEDAHLHSFIVQNTRVPFAEEGAPIDERLISIGQLHSGKIQKFDYVYDFGDDWRHSIQIESVSTGQMELEYPTCIAGKGACPIEDCGGIERWVRLLDALKYPRRKRDEDIEELLSILGKDFQPALLNLDETNQWLEKAFQKRRRRKSS